MAQSPESCTGARGARVSGFRFQVSDLEFGICLGFGVLDFEFPLTAVNGSVVSCQLPAVALLVQGV